MARRVAGQVAWQASVGLVMLVLATAIFVCRVGMSQLSPPGAASLVAVAIDVERVRTDGDRPSLDRVISQLRTAEARTAWAVIGRLGCDSAHCLLASTGGVDSTDADRAIRRAVARLPRTSEWPADLGGRVSVVVPVPLRNASGLPDALLLIGIDASPVVAQAELAAWVMLAFAAALWLLLILGTRRAVALSVGDQLRTLVDSLANDAPAAGPFRTPPSQARIARTDGDELQSLAAAIESAAERSVRQQTQFRTLVEDAPVGIARLEADGTVLATNSRSRQLLGVDAENPGVAWSSTFVQREQFDAFDTFLSSRSGTTNTIWNWQNGEGRLGVVRASIVSLPNGSGEPGAVLLVEDITTQHALEAQLLRTQKMDVVGQLAGGIAHDFNDLLTIVRANVMALDGVTESPELGAIDDAAARGGRLVRRLLTISRNDLFVSTPAPVGSLVFETVAMARRLIPARIRIEAPAEVPATLVAMDRDAVQQALLNLVLNARDSIAGDGIIRVETREGSSFSGVPHLIIAVCDDGAGMPADVLARAAEPFFTTKPPDEGTGLGLAVVYNTMQRLGGELRLRSTVAHGTEVELWFPVVQNPAATSQTPDQAHSPLKQGEATTHILLVEDEYGVRMATERVLRKLGYTVSSASNIAEAKRVMHAEQSLRLVVSDVMMPGGTGIDLYRSVRADKNEVPFLFVSGYAMESLEGILESDLRTSMLSKPWTLEELRSEVARMLALG